MGASPVNMPSLNILSVLLESLILSRLFHAVLSSPQPFHGVENVQLQPRQDDHNDFSCRSTIHHNPIVLLHGLGATYYEDLNVFEAYLRGKGFCTFSMTYGDYPGFPFVGGLQAINVSSVQIAEFIENVKVQTEASKVDLIGHSEGAFQSLYVSKFGGVASIIDKIVAVAPPTHGTSFGNLYKLAYLFGDLSREAVGLALQTFGCPACNDLGTDGPAVKRLNDPKPIVQPGNTVTIIVSKFDELVTPVPGASFIYEAGVRNVFVQDCYPQDVVGHIGEAYDPNVWKLIIQGLQADPGPANNCPVD